MSAQTSEAADPSVLEDLAVANHILFHQRVVDAFGHVSMRHPGRPDRFLLARNMAPALVTPGDIITFDLDGNPIGDDRPVYLERFIHGEIFRLRPDLMSVVHSHSPAVIPFGVLKNVPLRPICHMGGFLSPNAPVFEIRCVAGEESDLLIRNRDLGAALARELGPNSVVLMRGHGSTVVGGTLKQAVFRAVYTEVNARLQSESMRLGEVTFLNDAEAAAAAAANDSQIARAWDFWKLQASAR
jgi:ribulose-5-phosphate 4-epimerase/fuculose-1-phosphate aldolase